MINNMTSLPPRNGGKVTVVAKGRVNPGQVSGDGRSVVFGEFEPGVGESVFRWREGDALKLNTDGYSSFEARCNRDASVVVFNRYSLQDALDKHGNWDIGRWENGKVEVVAGSEHHELTPDVDDSGDVIVYDREDAKRRKAAIMRWSGGKTESVSDGSAVDLFADVSGDGKRTAWRRNLSEVWLQDQNGTNKPLTLMGEKPASVMLDRSGDKVLYSALDKDGDRDLFVTDLSTSQTTVVAGVKGVNEYDASFSGDGKTVVYTGLDFRKEEADMNVYVWRDGETEQLTWNDGGLNAKATVSDDGNAISWFWIDKNDLDNRKVLLWRKEETSQQPDLLSRTPRPGLR